MSASRIIFTFIDDDGNQFPIQLIGPFSPLESFRRRLNVARAIADEYIDSGDFRPNGNLRYLEHEKE